MIYVSPSRWKVLSVERGVNSLVHPHYIFVLCGYVIGVSKSASIVTISMFLDAVITSQAHNVRRKRRVVGPNENTEKRLLRAVK